MEQPRREWVESELRQALRALAAPVDVQLGLFAPFVCVTCELIESYQHFSGVAHALEPPLSDQLAGALRPVEIAMSQLSASDVTCHQSEPLRASPRWADVRRAAGEALTALKWPHVPPVADAPVGDGTWGRKPPSGPE
jgi:hypothetical protein